MLGYTDKHIQTQLIETGFKPLLSPDRIVSFPKPTLVYQLPLRLADGVARQFHHYCRRRPTRARAPDSGFTYQPHPWRYIETTSCHSDRELVRPRPSTSQPW